jgi:hypothetical protein
MDPLVLTEFSTIADTERALHAFADSASDGLQLQKQMINKRHGAIYDTARLQTLVTWARSTPRPYLQFHQSNTIDNVLEDLGDYAPGIAALRLADEVRVGSYVISRREALARAVSKMQATDALNLPAMIKGRSIDMTCVSGAQVQYLRPLFFARRPQAVRRSEDMHQLLRQLSGYINKDDADLVPDTILRALGIYVSELFSNTQEHATVDEAGIPYAAHVEGMIVSWNQLDEEDYAKDFTGHHRLKQFWEEESTLRSDRSRALRCLQLSFFDSGPGFAARAIGRPTTEMDLEAERSALLHCLKKNTTSKKQVGAGQGLPGVLTELSRTGGLIRIRSGRHALFNVFGSNTSTDLYDFSDWTAGALAPASGAVVSLIIPLRKGQQ